MIPIDPRRYLEKKSDIDASSNPANLPQGKKNTYRVISAGGQLGGEEGVGLTVLTGDILVCIKSTPPGTYTEVKDYWKFYSYGTLPPAFTVDENGDIVVG